MTIEVRVQQMLDIVNPSEQIEILIDHQGGTVWVNIDGICRLRCGHIAQGKLKLIDERLRRYTFCSRNGHDDGKQRTLAELAELTYLSEEDIDAILKLGPGERWFTNKPDEVGIVRLHI